MPDLLFVSETEKFGCFNKLIEIMIFTMTMVLYAQDAETFNDHKKEKCTVDFCLHY